MIKTLLVSLILIYSVATAGMNGLTFHSRANCGGFNESISWNAKGSHRMETESYHFYPGSHTQYHFIKDAMKMTWRSAAYHMYEGYEKQGWHVVGHHIMPIKNKPVIVQFTIADDCRFYDGWWATK